MQPLREWPSLQADAGERQVQAGAEGGKRFKLTGDLLLAEDLPGGVEDAHAAAFQTHVNSGILLHGFPS